MAQGIRVTIYDPDARQSRSLTITRRVAGISTSESADQVAQFLEDKLAERYAFVTKLNSRRHKRR